MMEKINSDMAKRIIIITIIAFFAVFLFVTIARKMNAQETDGYIYVNNLNGNDNNSGVKGSPKKTIQAGINAAVDLYNVAEVHVAGGMYAITSSILMKEGISIYGGYSQDFNNRNISQYVTTIVDESMSRGYSGNPSRVIYIDSGISQNTIIDGFTINAGDGNYTTCIFADSGSPTVSNNILNGGQVSGIAYCFYLKNGSSPAIINNIINGGDSDGASHAIYSNDSNAVIKFNEIIGGDVQSDTSHAIYSKHASLIIEGNNIRGGSCDSDQCYSCGIREANCSRSKIFNNVINGGNGYRSYGILTSDGSDPEVLNNVINGGNAQQTATGIYIKNDDNPRVINNIIYTTGGSSRYCINENDPGYDSRYTCDNDGIYDSNPGILRNNDLFDCPMGFVGVYDEDTRSGHNIRSFDQVLTTDEDGEGTLADWNNISEDLSNYLDSGGRFTGDLNNFDFDTVGRNGAHSNYNWGFSVDKDGHNRSPLDNSSIIGWSVGAYEYDSVVISAPSISLSKSSNTSSVNPGQEIIYTISYTNDSQTVANNVIIKDSIPPGTTYINNSATNNGIYNESQNRVEWNLGSIQGDFTGSVNFRVLVN